MTYDIREGDCLSVMAAMPDASVDSIVSDPPYGLAFMGKQWDHGVPAVPFWAEALRVAKPGAYLVAFGGSRTYHRLTCAIEDAGWEIRDCLSWLYGSGFPKSHDVSKAMDKAAGAEREVVGTRKVSPSDLGQNSGWNALDTSSGSYNYTAPATDLARQWHGWGTALKPAWEPIILARKPLIGTVAANVEQYGTGGINVDGCRIDPIEPRPARVKIGGASNGIYGDGLNNSRAVEDTTLGRWPANVVLDEEAAQALDAQTSGLAGATSRTPSTLRGVTGIGGANNLTIYGDSGGASRFFYTAKASRKEREAGLEGMEARVAQKWNSGGIAERRMETAKPLSNVHPTVKPIALMRWLCRLVTPKGGIVMDPFTGSGTTGCAAVLEGFRFVGIEREAEYVEIARKRVAHWAGQVAEPDLFADAK
jgi:site-specific DNA-methyltransferase (adenine-specific)